MKLKHIKLFESFDGGSNIPKMDKDPIFDWLPFDAMENDPIQKTIPQSLTLSELQNWIKGVDTALVEKAGLFISHSKISSGGFNRAIATKLSPMLFNFVTFNSNFEQINEYNDVPPSSITNVSKTTQMLSGLGLYDEDKE